MFRMSSTAASPTAEDPIAKSIVWSALAIVAALVLGVGPVSSTVLHHIVQTAPYWLAIVCRRRRWAAWFALACFVFWLIIMAAIWAFLLHLPSFVSGHFSPVEVAMTILCGIASLIGIAAAIRTRTRWPLALAAFAGGAAAQFAAFRISQIPFIWKH